MRRVVVVRQCWPSRLGQHGEKRRVPLFLTLVRSRTPLSLAHAKAKRSTVLPCHCRRLAVPTHCHRSSTARFLAPIALPPPPLPPRTTTTSRHALVWPHFASPPPRHYAIAIAPPCPLTAVAAPPLDSSRQQLHHLHLYLPEPLLPHVAPR